MGSRFSLESFLTPPQKVEKMFDAVNELVAQKAEMEAREAEEAKKAELDEKIKKLMAGGMSAAEFLEKLK